MSLKVKQHLSDTAIIRLMTEHTLIRNGLFFDGKGTKAAKKHILVRDGQLAELSDSEIQAPEGTRVIDAEGKWVMPGFIDIHTHYDAEVEAIPSLHESLRHGVTTVFMGSCSLSAAVGDPTDIADMFTRVEAIPYQHLLAADEGAARPGTTHAEYADHHRQPPAWAERDLVRRLLRRARPRHGARACPRCEGQADRGGARRRWSAPSQEGYDAGFLGLSLNGLYWDKMGGDRFRSKCLPSTYASWKELRRMVRGVRERGLNLQAIPNVSTKYRNLSSTAAFSAGLFVRRGTQDQRRVDHGPPLEPPHLAGARAGSGWAVNKVFGWQVPLPVPCRWRSTSGRTASRTSSSRSSGLGAAGLHLETMAERRKLFQEDGYRRKFNRQWNNPLIPKVFHRNFAKGNRHGVSGQLAGRQDLPRDRPHAGQVRG